MDSEKKARPPARRSGGGQWKAFLAGVLILVVVTGGALFGLNRFMGKGNHTAESAPATAPTAIEGAGPMPQWLAAAPSDVIADYTWAASHHDELQYFPCFCGCNKSAGHVSNSDCYFARDGRSTIKAYDAHAYG